mmetsp:Transcript_28619/g.43235  ORF Transcript_28619/g.43235 Transcript_28619/m.43235 type:complete len:357 (-) Transcript_28619:80-1150(-)|eukprot:scaffold10364_cov155-Skeletonema_dohrnii-CCMP3373.AAC.2
MEEWRNNSVVVTCINGDGEPVELICFPTSVVPMVPSEDNYSHEKRFRCSAETIDGKCACSSYGVEAFGSTCFQFQGKGKGKDFWLCPVDQKRLGLWPEEKGPLTVVETTRDDPPTIVQLRGTDKKIPLCGGCVELALSLMANEHILVTNRTPPSEREIKQHCKDIWYRKHPGKNRGAGFIGFDGHFKRVLDALKSMERSKELILEYQKLEGREIVYVVPALYLESNLRGKKHNSFKYHCDKKYKGKPPRRSNWTWNESRKVMRFQDRISGLFFDIACTHGTIVEQDWYASGCDESHRMEHCVLHANGTGTITFDHGQWDNDERNDVDIEALYDEFLREFQKEHQSDDEDDDEEEED